MGWGDGCVCVCVLYLDVIWGEATWIMTHKVVGVTCEYMFRGMGWFGGNLKDV